MFPKTRTREKERRKDGKQTEREIKKYLKRNKEGMRERLIDREREKVGDRISETKFPVPNCERNKKKFSVSFPKTGKGKSWCLIHIDSRQKIVKPDNRF